MECLNRRTASAHDAEYAESAAAIAPTANERAAKRPKLLPIKDESVEPIATRARSVFALGTQMHDVKLVETAALPEASAPSFVRSGLYLGHVRSVVRSP